MKFQEITVLLIVGISTYRAAKVLFRQFSKPHPEVHHQQSLTMGIGPEKTNQHDQRKPGGRRMVKLTEDAIEYLTCNDLRELRVPAAEALCQEWVGT